MKIDYAHLNMSSRKVMKKGQQQRQIEDLKNGKTGLREHVKYIIRNENYFKIDKISLMLIWLMTHVKNNCLQLTVLIRALSFPPSFTQLTQTCFKA